LGGERRLNMLLLSNTVWIIIVVAVAVLAVFIGKKNKRQILLERMGISPGF
jgi:Mn2+/Fe2+ NRAMP family transporter